jgi:hypothetical protein
VRPIIGKNGTKVVEFVCCRDELHRGRS